MNKKSQKTINEVILHGEAMLFRISELPAKASKISPSNRTYHIIADSETTGNHHVVDSEEGVFFFEKDGVTYMQNETPTRVRCLHENRHSTIDLQPGTWEFGIQQEYDHISQEMQKVRD
jgi:hypothetical protein